LLASLAIGYGVAGYTLLEGWPLLDSLYMTLSILSSVGLTEVRPLDASGKLFTVSLIAFGVAVILVSLGLVAAWIAEGNLGDRTRRKRMRRRIDALNDHFIICAYGRVGRTVAREFERAGVAFVVVEEREDLEEQMIEDGVAYLVADPSLEPALRAVGVERARGLVCAVDSDATNVYIALTARSLNPDIFIVARASESYSAERLSKAGADRVISPYVTSGRHMAMMALRPRVVDYMEMGTEDTQQVRMEELLIEAKSGLVGRTVGEATGKATPLAVRSRDGVIHTNPGQNFELHADDVLVLMGEESDLRPVEER
jgi:voltage-gated potassium channel